MLTFDMAGHKGRLWSMCKPNFLSLRCRLVDDGCGADYCTAIFSAEEKTSALLSAWTSDRGRPDAGVVCWASFAALLSVRPQCARCTAISSVEEKIFALRSVCVSQNSAVHCNL
jgi:hypothetical protein